MGEIRMRGLKKAINKFNSCNNNHIIYNYEIKTFYNVPLYNIEFLSKYNCDITEELYRHDLALNKVNARCIALDFDFKCELEIQLRELKLSCFNYGKIPDMSMNNFESIFEKYGDYYLHVWKQEIYYQIYDVNYFFKYLDNLKEKYLDFYGSYELIPNKEIERAAEFINIKYGKEYKDYYIKMVSEMKQK